MKKMLKTLQRKEEMIKKGGPTRPDAGDGIHSRRQGRRRVVSLRPREGVASAVLLVESTTSKAAFGAE